MRLAVRQIAYFVPDIRVAAERHAASFGSGPYFVADHIPLRRVLHRGREATLDHSSAYGQWGELMIEFVQQNDAGPSAFRDMFPGGGEGLHHVALIVDDFAATRTHLEAEGMATALYAEMMDGFAFAMMDATARYGHMIEIYEGVPVLTGFYDSVREASIGWDGGDVLRPISLG
jgi:hypothetical protein